MLSLLVLILVVEFINPFLYSPVNFLSSLSSSPSPSTLLHLLHFLGLVILLLWLTMVFIFIGALFCLHVYLCLTGQTTNEYFKNRRIRQQQQQLHRSSSSAQNSPQHPSPGEDHSPSIQEKVSSVMEGFVFQCGTIVFSLFTWTPIFFQKLSMGHLTRNNATGAATTLSSSSAMNLSHLHRPDIGDLSPPIIEPSLPAGATTGRSLYHSQGLVDDHAAPQNPGQHSHKQQQSRTCFPCGLSSFYSSGSYQQVNQRDGAGGIVHKDDLRSSAYYRISTDPSPVTGTTSIPAVFEGNGRPRQLHTRLLPLWQFPNTDDDEQQEVLQEMLYNQLQYELFHSADI